jgi:hypothetical protein
MFVFVTIKDISQNKLHGVHMQLKALCFFIIGELSSATIFRGLPADRCFDGTEVEEKQKFLFWCLC